MGIRPLLTGSMMVRRQTGKDKYQQPIFSELGPYPCRADESRPVRARGLKPEGVTVGQAEQVSRPVRARGLKLVLEGRRASKTGSRPVRARGLKHQPS